MVDGGTLTLTVGAVCAHIAVYGSTLIEGNAVVLQSIDQHLHGTGDLTLGVGVLYTQKKHAAALVRHPLRGQALHQIAQMDKTGGGGGHTGDHGTLRGIAAGEPGLHSLRCFGNIGEKKIG